MASQVMFAVIEMAPRDPASFMLGMDAQPETLSTLRAKLDFDVPKPERYLNRVSGMLVAGFRTSYTKRTPVAEMVAQRIQVSLPFAI